MQVLEHNQVILATEWIVLAEFVARRREEKLRTPFGEP